ncbi:MAG: hypothetical protein V1899_09185 [Planctomycetota bacterium]
MARSAYLTALEQRISELLSDFCHEQKATDQDFAVYVGRTSIGRFYATLTWNKFDGMEITQRQHCV